MRKKEPVTDDSPLNNLNDRNKLIAFVSIVAILIFVIVILKQVLSENEQPTVSPVHQRLMEQDTTKIEDELKNKVEIKTEVKAPVKETPKIVHAGC